MKYRLLPLFYFFISYSIYSQTPLFIPDTLSGHEINLSIKEGSHSFYASHNTSTIGYNGNLLGPTIILHKGQSVQMNVANELNDTTTTHWHGLHVSPQNDGSPHNLIMANTTWSPKFEVMDKAATYWYHPHLHGKTMKQVIQGAAGMIIVRDDEESKLHLPRTYGVDDIPLIMQWRTFDTNKQIVLDDEADNVAMVNGTINGVLEVPAQMVRFRLLNGSSHRFFNFAFSDNRNFQIIANDESLLNKPVSVKQLIVSPGERFEIIVDFKEQQGQSFFINQLGKSLPNGYPGGPPMGMMGMNMTMGPLDNTDFSLLKIDVKAPTLHAIKEISSSLTTNDMINESSATTRNFQLRGLPMMSMTNFTINSEQYDHEKINFKVKKDDVMIWNITNQSMMPHPWHIHGNYFYIKSINGQAPPAYMKGRKDVVTIPPMNGSAQIVMKYEDFADSEMPYMYHCHILSHEDGGMMGQFMVEDRTSSVAENSVDEYLKTTFDGDQIFILSMKGEQIDDIRLFNQMGQLVLRSSEVSDRTSLPIKNIVSGIYIVSVSIGKKVLNKKIFIF